MPVGPEDEYAALRSEMLKRFEWIHDTAKFGIGGFFAFASYYLSLPDADKFDPNFALLVMQGLVALMLLSALNNYKRIYMAGAYIAVIIEETHGVRWHRMSRGYSDFQKDVKEKAPNSAPASSGTWFTKLCCWAYRTVLRCVPDTLREWGGDSRQFGLVQIFFLFGSFVVMAISKAEPSLPHLWDQWTVVVFIVIIFVFDICLIGQLLWGMNKFRKETELWWKYYRNHFGDPQKYGDPYNTFINDDETLLLERINCQLNDGEKLGKLPWT